MFEIIKGSFGAIENELGAKGQGLDFVTLKNALKK